MPISTIGQNGLNAPITLTSPVINTVTSAASTALTLQSAGTTAMTIDTSQNVGIGTTSPTNGKLVISGNSVTTAQGIRLTGDTADARFICESATLGAGILGTFSNHSQLFYTNSAERMRIDSGGNVMVNTTTAIGTITTRNTSSYTMGSVRTGTGGEGHISFRNANGEVGYIQTSGTSTQYATFSDYRLKESIAPMTGALAKVIALNPVTYKWKSDGSNSQGFIAHELAEVVPDCVTGEKDAVDVEGNPQYQGIDTSFLVATLTAAIQELKTIVDAQAAEIAELKAKVA